jgi:hypothetical protein
LVATVFVNKRKEIVGVAISGVEAQELTRSKPLWGGRKFATAIFLDEKFNGMKEVIRVPAKEMDVIVLDSQNRI